MLKRAKFLENNQNCKADLPWVQWHCIIQRLGTVHMHLMYPQYLHMIFKGTTQVSKKSVDTLSVAHLSGNKLFSYAQNFLKIST